MSGPARIHRFCSMVWPARSSRARFRGLPTSGSVCSTTASPSDSVPRGSGCVSSYSIVPLESFNDNLLYFVTQKSVL